jgi:hypothetical protein
VVLCCWKDDGISIGCNELAPFQHPSGVSNHPPGHIGVRLIELPIQNEPAGILDGTRLEKMTQTNDTD